ncbi:interferon-induced protein with tetratricopeptide repeats 1-like [Rhinichthys klamathensis goyatoka]|uniref:interferon-induced protein with tetratricopeptide repeats 1-like n=1 Tax=Rhinichthys klamathensis goyatoka TaxID=3034132 RepID=UPI0024B52515|nr:interferon-induced protein with tetratricopeptide repeats 1-like [Rhinichthys klamathensis goyatoka]
MDNSSLKQRLERLECHFTWDLECSKNELQEFLSKLKYLDQETCTWLVHGYNLLGYIHQTLGSNTEAVKHLHKAESVIQEQGTEEAGVQLQVNKANLAWVYFHLGEMDKSKGYLEEVERLQRMHPAPPGCTLHPEVSGEKGWTLVKFNKSKKRQAIDCFKMALNAEPDRKEWHKGLAIAMNMEFASSEFTLDEIVEQLKIAHEKEPNSLFIHSHYLLKLCKQKKVDIEKEMQGLLERTLETGNLECLHVILRYYSEQDSLDKAIRIAETAHEKFPSSVKALKQLADCYKWKVYNMKDSEERETLARESIKLFETDLTYYPHSYKVKIDLASLHCYTHEIEKADEIYKNLLSEENDISPHRQQHLFYSYAQHLNHNKSQSRDSVSFYMKAAEIPVMTECKQKSIRVLKSIMRRGRDPRCMEIQHFLEGINSD